MKGNQTSGNTTVGDKYFVMERTFQAPRELVYKAFTLPEYIARWWAPGGYTIPVCRIDLRPGGVWHYCMRSPEGDEHWVKAIYQEIVIPERIVYTCTFADEDANPVDAIPEQLGTITFADFEGGTKISITIRLQTEEALKWTLDAGMVQGMTATFVNLDALLKEMN